MKWLLFFTLSCLLLGVAACRKDRFVTGKNAYLVTSDTALHFDTVFTTTGSITKQLKIININDQKLRITTLQLMGGSNSYFQMNVSGMPGTLFSNVELAAGDSLYVFVTVSAPANSQRLPFVVEDSIQIAYNGNTQWIRLDAYGQNAHFLRNVSIIHDTTWTNDLPFVLLDSFSIARGATLSLGRGVQVFCHANTPLYIQGSLQADGTADAGGRITFANDRLDAPYKDQPGTWQGLYFSPGSSGNVLNYVTIKNALQGIAADDETRLTLNQCIIDNCPGEGLIAYNASIRATNCLISNSGSNVYLLGGGTYLFNHCTIAAYSTPYFFHQYPALFVTNAASNGVDINPLNAVFRNSIIWGDDNVTEDEVNIVQQGSGTFNLLFENSLYKATSQNAAATYVNSLQQQDPLFVSVDAETNTFDFHLQPSSPCIDAGVPTGVTIDLEKNNRDNNPDIGCYEKK